MHGRETQSRKDGGSTYIRRSREKDHSSYTAREKSGRKCAIVILIPDNSGTSSNGRGRAHPGPPEMSGTVTDVRRHERRARDCRYYTEHRAWRPDGLLPPPLLSVRSNKRAEGTEEDPRAHPVIDDDGLRAVRGSALLKPRATDTYDRPRVELSKLPSK